ncbi:MAG: tagatose 1,6-diphosphate aldolase [Chloroflexia bacterium]
MGTQTELSIGKLRGLQQCASPEGIFVCLALDHRQNLRRILRPDAPSEVDGYTLSRFKVEVTAALAEQSTAVLLDPEYGAAQAVAAGALPGRVGLVVALEATGYEGEPHARRSRLLPGWDVAKAKRMGASMVKLLVYYHPESPTAEEVQALVRKVAAECRVHDIPLMLEPLGYSLDAARPLSPLERRKVAVSAARDLVGPGVELLKAEFLADARGEPDERAWGEACSELSGASRAPWILLSAAVDFETYLRQVAAACRAGASGVAVGRAVWQEAAGLSGQARTAFLRTTARERLARLTEVCTALAMPFSHFYRAEAPLDWYGRYGEGRP